MEIVRASGAALSEGIMMVAIEGVQVPVYNPAKTIADCFKYRRRVGLDVAIEALRDAIAKRKATRNCTSRAVSRCAHARICRSFRQAGPMECIFAADHACLCAAVLRSGDRGSTLFCGAGYPRIQVSVRL